MSNHPSPETIALAVQNLTSSGISQEQAAAAGIFPVNDARSLGFRFGVPALVFPYPGTDGAFFRVRYLQSEDVSGFVPKKIDRKYDQPAGTGVYAYMPDRIDWNAIKQRIETPVVITEGEKKALKAGLEGFPTIGLGGTWNFRRESALLPEILRLGLSGRTVYIAFDSDIATNSKITHAERVLAKLLAQAGATVKLIRIPSGADGAKQGLDDFFFGEPRA